MQLQQERGGGEERTAETSASATAFSSFTLKPVVALVLSLLLLVVVPFLCIRDREGNNGLFILPYLLAVIVPSLWYYLGSSIIVEEGGLRWRHWGGRWRTAAWSEVEDYFRTSTSFLSTVLDVVVVRGGRRLQIDTAWTNLRRFERLVAERATMARAQGWLYQSKDGTIVGTHTFAYLEKTYRSEVRMTVFAGLFFVFMLTLSFWAIGSETFTPQWAFAAVFLGFLVFVVWEQSKSIRALAERREHNEHIVADSQGITFWRDGVATPVAWSEVIALQRPQSPKTSYTIRYEAGTFSFSQKLDNYLLLISMIHFYAPHLRPASSIKPNEALQTTEWVDGKRLFHYRSRTYRRLSVQLFIGALLIGGITAFVDGLATGMIALFLFLTSWGLLVWHIQRTRIVLDREGLTFFRFRSRRRVLFEEITAIRGNRIETKDGKRPIGWSSELVGLDDLLDELIRRTGLKVTQD